MKKTLLIFSCICFSGVALADSPPVANRDWNCGCSWYKGDPISVTTKADGLKEYKKNLCVSPPNINDARYPKGHSSYCTKGYPIRVGGYVTCRSVSKVTLPSSGISDFTELSQDPYATPKSWLLCTDANNQKYSYLLKCYAKINPAENGHWVSNTLQDNSAGTKWCCRETTNKTICN